VLAYNKNTMDNTVGSLTQYQKSIIIGSLLGDGYLRVMKNRKNAFLEINHSYKQKEYVLWKYFALKNITASPPKARRGRGSRIAYRFFTRQHEELTELFHLFYHAGEKIIPNITINPIMLAVWFMDDGSRCRDSDVYLNTQQFSVRNQKKLLKFLDNQCGLQATLNKDKEYKRIRFIKSSIPRLQRIISPYIIPSMKYKLSYDPVETDS
jgi:hypothetical protein